MKKIVFGITSLGIGGAERVLVDIVNKLQNEYDITISIEDINLQISSVISAIDLVNDKYYNGEVHFRNKYIEL